MKNFKYWIQDKHYAEEEDVVYVWTGKYPFKIEYSFLDNKNSYDGKLKTLSKKFNLTDIRDVKQGKLTLNFYFNPEIGKNLHYKTTVGYLNIDGDYALDGTWMEVTTNNNKKQETEVVFSGDIVDEFVEKVQSRNLFLIRVLNIFYKTLIRNSLGFEEQLGKVELLNSQIVLKQRLYIEPENDNYKFIAKIKQKEDKFVVDEIIVKLDDRSYPGPIKWDGHLTLQEIKQQFNETIEEFAKESLEYYVQRNKDVGIEVTISGNEYQTAQDEDFYSLELKEEYEISGIKYPVEISAAVKIDKDSKVGFEYGEVKDLEISLESKKMFKNDLDALDDFHQIIKKELKNHIFWDLETDITSKGNTLEELIESEN